MTSPSYSRYRFPADMIHCYLALSALHAELSRRRGSACRDLTLGADLWATDRAPGIVTLSVFTCTRPLDVVTGSGNVNDLPSCCEPENLLAKPIICKRDNAAQSARSPAAAPNLALCRQHEGKRVDAATPTYRSSRGTIDFKTPS